MEKLGSSKEGVKETMPKALEIDNKENGNQDRQHTTFPPLYLLPHVQAVFLYLYFPIKSAESCEL